MPCFFEAGGRVSRLSQMAACMRTIGAFDAKNTLGTLLDLVEQGEEIVITRRGRPVAAARRIEEGRR